MSTNIKELEMRCEVLLTFQTALLGIITPALRGVTVAWSGKAIAGLLLFENDIAIEERECASDIEAEIAAAFPDQKVEVKAETYEFPKPMNQKGLTAWVYRRKE